VSRSCWAPLWFAVLAIGAGLNSATAEEGGSKPRISVRIQPDRVTPGQTVSIDGIVPLDVRAGGRPSIRLNVTRPDGKVSVLEVVVAPNGDYATSFGETATAGDYVVDATSPSGTSSGRGRFEVEVLEPLEELDAAVAELGALSSAILRITAEVDGELGKLPDTAARDSVRAKWNTARPRLERAVRDLGDVDELFAPFRETSRYPTTVRAAEPLVSELRDWTRTSIEQRTRILERLDASRGPNSRCEAAERITEGMNFAAALANLMGGAVGAVKAVVVDFIAAKAADVVGNLARQLKCPAAEATKVAAAIAEAKVMGILSAEKLSVRAAAKEAVLGNALGIGFDFGSAVAQEAFNVYCERMAGNFGGMMHAEFITTGGTIWWMYDIEFDGRIELRYAKPDAAHADSSLITRVNGEIIGQATRFQADEDALREAAPSLLAGAILFKRSILPQPELLNLLTLAPWQLDARPTEPRPIDIEGKVAATMVKPYTFWVPVEGEIVDGILTLRLKPATKDYEAAMRTVYVVFTPLYTLHPLPTAFELPFATGELFLQRAFGDDPLRVPVKKLPKALMVEETLRREKGNGRANGTYRMTFQLCNPEGKC
jgi:hypothetical protein